MPYPAFTQSSLDQVSKTRASRATQSIPFLQPDEKTDLLHEHHPDFRDGASRPLAVGSNKGSQVPVQLADVLESPSVIDADSLSLEEFDRDIDVLVIGGGGAGSTAALTAHENGARVLLATKLRHGDSNTIMAEGGIAAATRRDDSPIIHYVDTMRGGRFENIPALVKSLVLDAPLIVAWLESLGVLFDRNPDNTILTHAPAGHSRPRSHSCQDLTGLEIMRVLRDEIRCRGIDVLEFSAAVDLILDDHGQCCGAVLQDLDSGRFVLMRAKCVIVATGGLGRLHVQGFPTSNHYGATADGLVIGYRAGASLAFIDAVQYHPTGVVWPEQLLGQLVTEAMRARGAQLVNVEGERFINELETRDTISSAIIRECNTRRKGISTESGSVGLWLDTPMVDRIHGKGYFRSLFAGVCARFAEYGVDVTEEPILVFPTQHYQNGGLLIDEHGRTCVPGLYAAGEVSGGIHGRNRLGANSLVDVFVFGRRAGAHAAQACKQVIHGRPSLQHVREYDAEVARYGTPGVARSPILFPDYVRKTRGATRGGDARPSTSLSVERT